MTRRLTGAVQPGPGQESVWDYPRPPAVMPDKRLVTVIVNRQEIAKSVDTIRILETSHPPTFYIPAGDVCTQRLKPSQHASFCEYKGQVAI